MGMGVSGGEEGARNGPSLMPGGDKKAFDLMEPILTKWVVVAVFVSATGVRWRGGRCDNSD